MADNWFFLSHARLDRDEDPGNSIKTFFESISQELKRRKNIKEGGAGFFDADGIQQGSDWTQTLDYALRTCLTMVSVYSAAYFQSEWCGREWAVFQSRLDAYVKTLPAGTTRPGLILPVLLDPLDEIEEVQRALQLPDWVMRTQTVTEDYPEAYLQYGLKGLLARPKTFGEVYTDVRDIFVKKLLAVTKDHLLPEGPSIPDLVKVQSAWETQTGGSTHAVATDSARLSGTRYAEFVYVAARRDEIEQAKLRADDGLVYYGNQGGLDWKLYYPEVRDEVAFLTQKVALNEGFIILPVRPGADILQIMKDAEQAGRIVIIIADTWTLCLDKYRDQMLSHDDYTSLNCSVLIAWNGNDTETRNNRTKLQQAVRQAFKKKSRFRDERYFVDTINTPEDLEKFLATTLQKIRSQVIDTTKDYVTAAEGAEAISQPLISPV